MPNHEFPATRAAIRRLEEMRTSGQIKRPAAGPAQDHALQDSSCQANIGPTLELPSPIDLAVNLTINAPAASLPVSVSISVSTTSDGRTPDRVGPTHDPHSARRADLNLRNRSRRLGPAENAR